MRETEACRHASIEAIPLSSQYTETALGFLYPPAR
jgi:hypothetical protein